MAKTTRTKTSGDKKGSSDKVSGTEPAFFYFIKLTAQGRLQANKKLEEKQRNITTIVNQLGGKCELYFARGPYDYVSKVTGIDVVAALKLIQEIETSGNVTVTLMPTIRIFK